jgi:hypothetical protein
MYKTIHDLSVAACDGAESWDLADFAMASDRSGLACLGHLTFGGMPTRELHKSRILAACDGHAVSRKLGENAVGVIWGDDRYGPLVVQVDEQRDLLAWPTRVKVEPVNQVAAAMDTPFPHDPERHLLDLTDGRILNVL